MLLALSLLDLRIAMSFCSCMTALHMARVSSTCVGMGAASVSCVSCAYCKKPSALKVPPVAPIAIAIATVAPRMIFWPTVAGAGAAPLPGFDPGWVEACVVDAAPDHAALLLPVIIPLVPFSWWMNWKPWRLLNGYKLPLAQSIFGISWKHRIAHAHGGLAATRRDSDAGPPEPPRAPLTCRSRPRGRARSG